MVQCALALAGAFLALCFVFATSAQTTLFSDNFQDGDQAGWSRSGGTWTVVTDGSLVMRQSGTSADARARAGSTTWTDYSVQARVKPIAFGGAGRYVALFARAENVNHFYYLALQNGNQLVLAKRDGDTSTNLASRTFTVTTGTFFTLRLDVRGSLLSGSVNGGTPMTANDSQFTAGNIGGAGRYVALLARAENVNHFYYLALQNGNLLVLAKRDGGTSTILGSKTFTVTTGTFYTLRIDVRGSSLAAFVNGVSQFTANDTQFPAGNVGGATFFASGSFDDFVVTSLSGAVTPPPTPTGLVATPGNGQVSLSWNASSGATSYNVKRATVSGGPYTTIATGVTSTNFTNTGLTNGTTFFYVVSAVNSAGQSANSAQVSATPTGGVTVPAAPTGLTAT